MGAFDTVLSELGIRAVVNAAGSFSALGGSTLTPGVTEAMAAASRAYVDLSALNRAVGDRIAGLTGNEAAYVSSGAAAGVVLTVAAAMTGTDERLIRALPDVSTLRKRHVVTFRGQSNVYDAVCALTGAQLRRIDGSLDALRASLGARTACVLYYAGAHLEHGVPPLEAVVDIAHRSSIPVVVNAAAQVPPVSSLWAFTVGAGADAVVISGGKGLGGPQPSGVIAGRRDLIEACRANGSPNIGVGRPMKVGREEILGLLAAVEEALTWDEAAMIARYERTVDHWISGLADIDGVDVSRGYPSVGGHPYGNAVVRFGETPSRWPRGEVEHTLWHHDPPIAVAAPAFDLDAVALNPQMLQDGEAAIVLQAVRSALRQLFSASPDDQRQQPRGIERRWELSTQGWMTYSSNLRPT